MIDRVVGVEGGEDVGIGAVECLDPGLNELARLHLTDTR